MGNQIDKMKVNLSLKAQRRKLCELLVSMRNFHINSVIQNSLFDIQHSALSILIVVIGKQRLGKLIGIKIT